MQNLKPGPKPRAGARYPSGRLKPYQADVTPTLVRRMRDMARSGAADPNLGTPLGWLYLTMEISQPQMAAGLEYARVRARYDRAIDAPSRTSASPSYGAAFGKDAGSVLADEDREAVSRQAIMENGRMLVAIGATTAQLALLDQVCVENEHPTWSQRQELGPLLTALAVHFRLMPQPKRETA